MIRSSASMTQHLAGAMHVPAVQAAGGCNPPEHVLVGMWTIQRPRENDSAALASSKHD